MAFPVIKVGSTNGAKSDTACSGAGPTTAKTGTAASSTTTTNIDITDVVDLSGVATDGSAVIYFADTTAGHRRFARITGITGGPSGSTWHVALDANSPVTTTVGPFAWAIGGTRATVGGAVSVLLFDNNTAPGDAMPGWTEEMQSGHVETVTATINVRRSGDTTNGPITLRGLSGAATRPVLTFSNNAAAFKFASTPVNCIIIQDFDLKNSAATRTSSIGIDIGVASQLSRAVVSGMKIAAASPNNFNKGIVPGERSVIIGNEVANTIATGIDGNSTAFSESSGCHYMFNYVHNCGSHGIDTGANGGSAFSHVIFGNICYNNGGSGIKHSGIQGGIIAHNICDNNTAAGLLLTITGNNSGMAFNNVLSNNGTYGIDLSGSSDAGILGDLYRVFNNSTYNNTSGTYKSSTAAYAFNTCPWATGDTGLDPTYTNAAGGDFSIGTNLKAQGYPLGGTLPVGTLSSTYSYVDPGAAQRQEPVATTAVQSLILQPTGTY